MSSRDPPNLRKTQEADYSYFFAKDRNAGVSPGTIWNNEKRAPWPYVGFRTLFCRNCGQFISEKDASNHDDFHRSQQFEDLYRRKVMGRRVA